MLTPLLLLAAAAGDGQAHDPKKRIRCVREDIIGSLATKRRVCHTLEEWERIRRGANDEIQRVYEQGRGRPSGNG